MDGEGEGRAQKARSRLIMTVSMAEKRKREVRAEVAGLPLEAPGTRWEPVSSLVPSGILLDLLVYVMARGHSCLSYF